MEEHRRNFFLISVVICMFTILGIVFMSSFATPAQAAFFQTSEPEIVRTYSAESNEFYCRTVGENGEHYLKFDGSKNLIIADNPSEAIFNITFSSESTVTITNGGYSIGYKDGAELTTSSSSWTLVGGLLKNSNGDRTLLWSKTEEHGRAYKGNIGASYDPVYFYSNIQYNEAEQRCSWTDDRQTKLTNLTYNIGTRHTISFNANGGSGVMPDNYILDGDEYVVPETSLFMAPKYMKFDGWALTPEGSKITDPIEITENITLYALWKKAEVIVATVLPIDYDPVTEKAISINWDFINISITTGTITGSITDYPNGQFRIFKGRTITIISLDDKKPLRRIEFTCTANGTAKYGPGCFAPVVGYSYSGKTGVWDGNTTDPVSFTASSNQVRATQIIISCDNL